jgi:chemotaxis protein methyltransferase CheR
MRQARQLNECESGLSNDDFTRLSGLIYDECGIKMPDVKRTMLEARLGKRLKSLGLHSFGDYCNFLFSREGMERELLPMIDLVTTNKTDFFREAAHFDHMSLKVLPEWLSKGENPDRRLKVWSAGCSTGEEPYTLAMVLNEFALQHPGFDYSILATDISTRVLESAVTAVYDEEKIEPVPQPLKRKYLLRSRERSCGKVRIVPELRAKVRFRRLNFMDADFGIADRFDIIFCRNVVIYFDRPTQVRLLNKFCTHLAADGYVFMGHSETLNGLDVPLVMVHPTVYRKNSVETLAANKTRHGNLYG